MPRKKDPDPIALTKNELNNVLEYTDDILHNLPDKALEELLEGDQGDVDNLLEDVMGCVHEIIHYNNHTEKSFGGLENFEKEFDDGMKRLSYNYFKTTMLPRFEQHERNIEWGNLIQLFPWSAYLCRRGGGKSFEYCYSWPLWRLWRYNKPSFLSKDSIDNRNSKETVIITNESRLAKRHMNLINEEIRTNELIKEKLLPDSMSDLGKEKILCRNGASVEYRTYGSFIRGLHVGGVVVDDFLDESALYSKDQRDKFHEIFYGAIKSIVEPYGYLLVSGCVNPDTIILSKQGLRRIGELSPINYKTNKCSVDYELSVMGRGGFNKTSKYWINGLTDTRKIRVLGGYELEGSLIHPVLVMDKTGILSWKKFSELETGDWISIRSNQGFGESSKISMKDFIQVGQKNARKINVGDYLDETLSYFFGLWVADGSYDKTKSGFTIIKNNKGIRDFVLSKFNNTDFKPRNKDEIKMDFNSVNLEKLFDFVGANKITAKHKSVPKKIFESDRETIVSFLRGYFDGDGCFYRDKKTHLCQVSIGSISEKLIEEVHILLLHLGIFSIKTTKHPAISDKVVGKNDVYVLTITGVDCKNFIEKIGFKYSGKYDNEQILSNNINSLFRRVPYQSNIIKNARKEQRKRNNKQNFHSQQTLNETINKEQLEVVYNWLISNEASGYYTDLLKDNVNNDFTYLPIKSIESGKGYTVDFVIPNDHTFLTNGIISHNTPYHEDDLYQKLKEDPMFKVFEYPAILPDGTIVAKDRGDYKFLMELKKSLGSIVFSREYLVTPVSDSSSIFPWEFLNKSFIGMENVDFVENIESFPIKMDRVVIGCDFAISGKIGADFSVFSVWGRAQGNYYLMHMWRKSGASHREQVDVICRLNQMFKANRIVAENNGFQRVIIDLVKERGVNNIEEFTTTAKTKKDSYEGLPSISAMFERGEIKIPYKEGKSKDTANLICGEFNSITFMEDTGKLESAGGHDDCAMSSFFALTDLREKKSGLKISYI